MTVQLSYNDIITINVWGQGIVDDVIPSYGIREKNLLMSIPNAIYQTAFGQDVYPTTIDKSAYLWESLSKFHCFYNGNKRTALLVTVVFLAIEGYEFIVDNNLYNISLLIASGELDREQIHEYLVSHSIINQRGLNSSPDLMSYLEKCIGDPLLVSTLKELART